MESDLPEDITEKCVLCFEAAVANHMNIGDAIKKVQNEPLKEIDEKFKGQRYEFLCWPHVSGNLSSLSGIVQL